jgi:2-dehydro-3-deoxyphosphogluconate aldolase / (4S)-4-hydroxy-2-oxoglutarate aldolase
MSKDKTIINQIKQQGMLPLFYHAGFEESRSVVQAFYEAGIRIIEYTNRGAGALNNFKQLLELRDKEWPDLLLAAGTIKTVKDAKNFCKAGADFIICPGTVKEVANKVQDAGLLWIPGCQSPTEIILAEQCGARLVKIFPGSLLGPGYITAIRDIFPGIDFMPTGGVDASKESIEAWFKAGAVAVGMGSKLVSKELLDKQDYGTITSLAKELIGIINILKNPS